VRASLSSTVDDMLKWFNCDAMLTFERPYRSERVQLEALNVPGVTQTDVWLQLPTRQVYPDGTESAMMYMFGPTVTEASLILSPGISEGRWLMPGDDNAIVVPSGLLRDNPGLHLGGEIVLKIDGRDRTFTIVGTYVGMDFGSILYANYDYLARLTNRVGEADAVMIRTDSHGTDDVAAASSILENRFERLGLRVSTVTTLPGERAEAEAIFDSIVSLLLVMAVLLALVGGLGLMGTMSINVLERTREIGVLRAIGAPNRGVAQVFILEGIVIGLMSWWMGGLLAIPMSQGLNQALGEAMMGVSLTHAYSMAGLWTWLVVVICLSALSSFIPARNASRMTVREVLAYE
jgi:putative ABC transport system permease protein